MTELIPINLFSEADTQLLMSRLWSLLAKQTERYTMGESTSVTVETAQELLASLWHTLTVAMDETNTPYTRLLTDDLLPVVKQGRRFFWTSWPGRSAYGRLFAKPHRRFKTSTIWIRSGALVAIFSTTIYTLSPTKNRPASIIRS